MRKILGLLIVLTVLLFGDNNESYFENWKMSNQLNNYFVNIKKEKLKANNYDEYVGYTALQTNIDYNKDRFYFQATPYMYIYQSSSNNKIKGGEKEFEKSDIFFRSLYGKYTINDKWGVGFGVLPFSNSSFMQYNNDYISDGEGLSTLNDSDFLSLFGTYNIRENTKTVFGMGTLDTGIIPVGKYSDDTMKKMQTAFIIVKDNYEKWKFTYELAYGKNFYEDTYIGNGLLFGLGSAWDDSEFSGWTFYNIVGLSYFHNKIGNAREQILTDNNIPQNYPELFPNQFAFDDKKYYGASNLFGFRKDLDIFPLDTMINIEWFHTFGDWASHNTGSPYNSNCNQIYSIRNNSYFINYGIRATENLMIKINYAYLEFKEVGKIGADLDTIPTNERLFGPQRTKTEIIKLELRYKF